MAAGILHPIRSRVGSSAASRPRIRHPSLAMDTTARCALVIVLGTAAGAGCMHENLRRAPRGATAAPRARRTQPASDAPRRASRPSTTEASAATTTSGDVPDVDATSRLLSAASGLEALAVFRGPVSADENALTAKWMIVSATADDDKQSASCVRTTTATRCVQFTGYQRDHLVDVFAREHYTAVCGVAIEASEIDELLHLVGSHALRALPPEPPDDP